MTGADLICCTLVEAGVDTVFGYPGGAIMPFYDALLRHPLRHVLVRHEANAGFAADGYARASGGLGVCVATSGPGATNLVTPLASAFMDSVPVLAVTGQVSSALVGTDAFQETDVTGVMLPVTKWAALVRHPEELQPALQRAIAVAMSGRRGPVLLDICKDVQTAPMPTHAVSPRAGINSFPFATADAQGDAPSLDAPALSEVGQMVLRSTRAVILAGHGVRAARAQADLQALAEAWNVPVATTLLGIGSIPEDHPLALGMMGMHGAAPTNRRIAGADLVLAVGMRFDDRVTGRLDQYLPDAAVIHVDVDAAEIGKNVRPHVAIVADAREALRALATLPGPQRCDTQTPAQVERERSTLLQHLHGGPLVAPQVLAILDEVAAGDAVIATDVGQHQMWEAQHVTHTAQRTLLTSGGAGAMGYALGAALGAWMAQPDREVWAVCGDGGFQMASPELATLAQEDARVRCVVLDNGYLGMVRQWQELFFEGRYSCTRLSGPDLVALAQAHGIAGYCADDVDSVRDALQRAAQADGPVLVDCRILADDNVLPMIAPGRALDEMIERA